MGAYVNGVYVPTVGESGWADELNDFLTAAGRGYIDVTLAPYGADPTGTNNSATAINAALTALGTTGGSIYIPPGTYKISAPINIPADATASGVPTQGPIHIRGAGAATKLLLANSTNTNVVQTSGWSSLQATGSSKGNWRCTISDLVIDGNKANQVDGLGLALYGWANTVRNVKVQNCKSSGIWTEWGTDRTGTDIDTAMESRFDGVTTENNGANGWVHNGPHDSIFTGIVSKQNTAWGFYNQGASGGNGAGSHIWNMNCYNNSGGSFYTSKTVMAVDLALGTTNAATNLYIDTGATQCLFRALTMGTGDIGIESKGSYCQFQGYVDKGQTACVKLNGAFANVFDLYVAAPAAGYLFTSSNGANMMRGTIVTSGAGVPLSGTPNTSDVFDLHVAGTTDYSIQRGRNNATVHRTGSPVKGMQMYDTTINKPIWYDGATWRDAAGTAV